MSSPYRAEFFRLLFQAGATQLTGVLSNFAVQSQDEHLEGFIQMLDAGLEEAQSALALKSWLVREAASPIEKPDQKVALEKRMLRNETFTAVHATPAELLAMTFWPRDPRRAVGSSEVPMSASSLMRLQRLGRALLELQECPLLTASAIGPRPFDDFLANCMSGVRNRQALDELVALVPAARRADLWSMPRKIRNPRQQHDAREGLLAEIALCEVNAPAVACCLAQDAASAPAMAQTLQREPYTTMEKVALVMVKDCAADRLRQPDSLMHSLLQVVRSLSLEQQVQTLCKLLTAAMDRLSGTAAPTHALDAVELLWASRPACFEQTLAGQPKELQEFLQAAAGASHLPALQAFRREIVAGIQAMPRPPEAQHWIASMAFKMASSACGETSQVAGQAFDECARFLHDCGCPLAELRFRDDDTLLHRMAAHKRPQALAAMLTLVDLGCDPHAKNGRGRTPATVMDKGEHRQEWLTVLRSRDARQAAWLALGQAEGMPGPAAG